MFSVDRKGVVAGKKSVVVLHCRNVFEEKIVADSNKLKVQGVLSLNGKNVGNIINFNFDKKSEQYQGEVDTNALTELRFYELKLDVSDENIKYSVVKSVGITNKMTVQNFKFEVVQSKVAPKILSNEVAFGQTLKEELSANQNSYIHVQFEVKATIITIFIFKS